MALSALKPGANLQDATEKARKANEKRYQEALGLTDQMMALYGPDFQKGAEAELARAKRQSVDQGMNALIQSGLGATGGAASLATAWEQSVGSEARLKLEDLIAQNKAAALQAKINVIASKEDLYPDYAQIYSGAAGRAAAAGSSMNNMPGTWGRSWSPSPAVATGWSGVSHGYRPPGTTSMSSTPTASTEAQEPNTYGDLPSYTLAPVWEPTNFDNWFVETYLQPGTEAAEKKKLESAYSITQPTVTSGPVLDPNTYSDPLSYMDTLLWDPNTYDPQWFDYSDPLRSGYGY